MTTVLLTGFGPFPGAPSNPTGALATALASPRSWTTPGLRRAAHVFETSYAAVDRDLVPLIARVRPAVLIMFGLAARSRHIRIETLARNARSTSTADAGGHVPSTGTIAPDRQPLHLPAPAHALAAAVRAAGLPVAVSRNAGDYLCNYLCWRAVETAQRLAAPRLIAFVHVPKVYGPFRSLCAGEMRRRLAGSPPLAFSDLMLAGETILRAAALSHPH
jgi:pyroglutamyl-peptidase